MELTNETLRLLLQGAFDLGYNNSSEFRAELIEELLAGFWKNQETKSKVEEYKVYSSNELQKMPEGTIFQHPEMGRGWIVVRPGTREKSMHFQKGGIVAIINNQEPWDKPMKLLHTDSLMGEQQ
jgi:hypothetical protein